MPPSQHRPPLLLLFVSLVHFNCTLLPALFTPVVAPVSDHFHPVCAWAVWSIHSLVAWASLCLGSTPLHGGNVPSIGKSISFIFSINRLYSWLVCFFFFFSSPFISLVNFLSQFQHRLLTLSVVSSVSMSSYSHVFSN